MARNTPNYGLLRARLETIKKKRRLSLRDLSAETGASPATLSRFMNHEGVPDLKTVAGIADWLELDVTTLFSPPATAPQSPPDVLEAQLRADPKLDPQTAEALSSGFRELYTKFTDDPTNKKQKTRARRRS